MRTTQPPTLNDNRLPRLIIWAKAMLLWAAAVMLGERIAPRRHLRQRSRALSITKLTHLVRNLLIIRAAEVVRHRPPAPWRNFAPAGFLHRRGRCRLRTIAGSRLRRLLNEGDLAARLMRFVHIVRNLDACARKFLLRRARSGLGHLNSLIVTRPQAHALPLRPAHPPAPADSS
jgi:hypothetical protein